MKKIFTLAILAIAACTTSVEAKEFQDSFENLKNLSATDGTATGDSGTSYTYSNLFSQSDGKWFKNSAQSIIVAHNENGYVNRIFVNLFAKNAKSEGYQLPFTIYFSHNPLNWDNLESAEEMIRFDDESVASYHKDRFSAFKTVYPSDNSSYSYVAIAIKKSDEYTASDGMGYINDLTFTWECAEKATVSDPSFSIAPNSDLVSGTTVTVIKPEDAAKLFVRINGGDFVEFSSNADVTITEDTVIEAYAMNDEGTESNHVTAFYSVEETEGNIDAINPFIFYPEGNWSSYADQAHQGTCASGKLYTFHGAYKNHEGAAQVEGKQPGVFNFTSANHFLTNAVSNGRGEGEELYCLKVDRAIGEKVGTVYVAFSDTPFTSIYDVNNAATKVTVSNDPNVEADYNFSQLISVKDAYAATNPDKESAKYFAVFPGNGTGMEVPRMVATYSNILTGVDKIETEAANGAEEIFSVNGYRVNGTDLAPGLYIRKHNGKTEKFVVK